MALRQRLIGSQHAQAPESEAGSHGSALSSHVVADRNGVGSGGKLAAGDLHEAKVGSTLSAVADNDQLDLSENETVAAAVLAHDVVQVGEAAEVLDLLDVALDTHASVEAVKGLDKADDAG